ncbi:RagB/SusD family nutrient uptake outer membrane protein [Flavihumibacter sp. R14]|nr:RagB/SusD family nutrient uptake outer membrane protein [Flavihumibacter soli]
MKKRYITKVLMIAFLATLTTSCDKNLEFEPSQSIDASTALESETDIQSAVIGSYSILGGGALYGTNLNIIPELLGSDNYVRWVGTFQSYRQIANRALLPNNADVTRTWVDAYSAINNVNNVLANLDKVSEPAMQSTFEGEALWVRGIMHFELVRLYALPYDSATPGANTQLGIPISLVAVNAEEPAAVKAKRNTVEEVYSQVLSDLTSAISKLPADNGARADQFTALAFRSRVYLAMGKYAEALADANTIIANSRFQLSATLESVFSNKRTSETLFEVEQNDQNNAGTSNDGLTTFYASLEGIGRADLRVNSPFQALYSSTDARGRDLIYTGVGARPGNLYTGKWKTFGQNIPVIRLAEMYLTRAECNFRLGTAVGGTSISDVNLIRVRSGAAPLATINLNDILSERQLELAFEGSRIHDLRRTKRSTGTFAYNSPAMVFPIPEREMRANSELVQNPGY